MQPPLPFSSLSAFVQENNIPGLNLGWVSTGGNGDKESKEAKPHTWSTGVGNIEANLAMTPNHRMPAGSVGKTFTAAATLALLDKYRFSLDEPIATWLASEPWYKNWEPQAAAITLRMLLNHTSGIPDHRIAQPFIEALKQKLSGDPPDYDVYFPPTMLIDFVQDRPLDFAPGSQFHYSETGYIVCGIILEHLAGEPYYHLVERLFLKPLGLDDTLPATSGEMARLTQDHLAQGHFGANDIGFPEYTTRDGMLIVNPATEWTGGGFISSASDLARWARILYRGAALDVPYLDSMLHSRFSDAEFKSNYGLGCYHWPSRIGTLYGHSGEAPGYRSIMVYSPALDASLALQINTSVPQHEVLQELLTLAIDAVFD